MEVMLAIMISFVAVIQVWQHKKLYQTDVSGRITEQCHSYRHCAAVSCIVISGKIVKISSDINEARLESFSIQLQFRAYVIVK